MSLTKRERQFLEGKLKLEKGCAYERRLRSDIKKKLGTSFSFAVVCIFCERVFTQAKMWKISTVAGDNAVYACADCAPRGVKVKSVTVTRCASASVSTQPRKFAEEVT